MNTAQHLAAKETDESKKEEKISDGQDSKLILVFLTFVICLSNVHSNIFNRQKYVNFVFIADGICLKWPKRENAA